MSFYLYTVILEYYYHCFVLLVNYQLDVEKAFLLLREADIQFTNQARCTAYGFDSLCFQLL